MAIAIKNVPTLENEVAKDFVEKANTALAKKATIDFKENSQKAKSILQKAKLI